MLCAQQGDVRLTPTIPTSIPQLLNESMIQGAARIDSTVLVVWGSTVLEGDSAVPVLVMQRVRSGLTLDQPRVLSAPSARPGDWVQVVPVAGRFLVVWNDRRSNAPGIYTRTVDVDGSVGAERHTRTPSLSTIDSLGWDVRMLPQLPGRALVLWEGAPLVVDVVSGLVDELDTVVADRFASPFHLSDDGELALYTQDTFRVYTSFRDSLPRDVIARPLRSGTDPLPFGALLITRDTVGRYFLDWSRHYSYTTSGSVTSYYFNSMRAPVRDTGIEYICTAWLLDARHGYSYVKVDAVRSTPRCGGGHVLQFFYHLAASGYYEPSRGEYVAGTDTTVVIRIGVDSEGLPAYYAAHHLFCTDTLKHCAPDWIVPVQRLADTTSSAVLLPTLDSLKLSYRFVASVPIAARRDESMELVVLPTPVSERLSVVTGERREQVALTLVAANGERVWSGAAEAGRASIDVRDLPAGVYLLEARSGAHGACRSVVVMH